MESKFGEKLKVKIRGGSHEPSVSVSIKGLPAGFEPDMARLQAFLDRRAPGRNDLVSSRKEADVPVRLDDGRTGEMVFEIRNTDVRRADYDAIRNVPRPGHADYTARLRYGEDVDMSGGGPFSGRMTAPLCVAGGLALQVLEARGIHVSARLISAGGNRNVEPVIRRARELGDSVGGIVECTATGVPGGIGDAMYGGLESRLSPILFGIPAVKGVDFGAGFGAAAMKGSENNDAFYCDEKPAPGQLPRLKTRTNNCGGILGGITNGMPVVCRVAFKPTPSIAIPQESVDLTSGESTSLMVSGRHDPCVAVRAVPAVEAAVALGLLDAILVTEASPGIKTNKRDLTQLRREIDKTDDAMLDLFEQRMRISHQVAHAKKAAGLPIENAARENEILQDISAKTSPAFAPYAPAFFKMLFAISKDYQTSCMNREIYGLIGHPLPHSFSKEIHEALGEYCFSLFDLAPEEMKAFVSSRRFTGLTVTRPYKQDVIPFCDRLTSRAQEIGAVNTLYFEDEKLVGHNTDYDGFLYTADRSGISFEGKNVLILGTGGTSRTVCCACADRGAASICFASRKGRMGKYVLGYEDLPSIANQIDIIVNTTPVGTYPDNLQSIINLRGFHRCSGVIDVVYNPFRTALLLDAEALGMKTANGMPMIVAQAMAAAERFLDSPGQFMKHTEAILKHMENRMGNIVLIGMPGCGKTTVGMKLAERSGRKFVDLDSEIVNETGLSIPDLFDKYGETFFRKVESLVARKVGCEHGLIIATGGGIVLNDDNYRALKQNGSIIWLTRPVEELTMNGRPLSVSLATLAKMDVERTPLYRKWADFIMKSEDFFK